MLGSYALRIYQICTEERALRLQALFNSGSDLRELLPSICDIMTLCSVNMPRVQQPAKARTFFACFDAIGLVEPRKTDEIPCFNFIKMQKRFGLLGLDTRAIYSMEIVFHNFLLRRSRLDF